MSSFVSCPVCSHQVASTLINDHLNTCLSSDTKQADAATAAAAEPPPPMSAFERALAGASRAAANTSAPAGKPPSVGRAGDKREREAPGQPPPQREGPRVEDRRPAKVARKAASAPLAERMRPRCLSEFIGQNEALATYTPLLGNDTLPSLILWGPPGCGKVSVCDTVTARPPARPRRRRRRRICFPLSTSSRS